MTIRFSIGITLIIKRILVVFIIRFLVLKEVVTQIFFAVIISFIRILRNRVGISVRSDDVQAVTAAGDTVIKVLFFKISEKIFDIIMIFRHKCNLLF